VQATPITSGGRHLLVFNDQMLEQAAQLAASHTGSGRPRYAGPVGSHLRHLIEHWEALVFALQPGWVDYDARPRDAALETDPALAQARLMALRTQLECWDDAQLSTPVQVRGLCGAEGEFAFEVTSSLGRELAFVASHAVHHFAWLRLHGLQAGVADGPGFGKAPATLAFERQQTAASLGANGSTGRAARGQRALRQRESSESISGVELEGTAQPGQR
jgi:hypothetical protein